jgi:hypothetical protein
MSDRLVQVRADIHVRDGSNGGVGLRCAAEDGEGFTMARGCRGRCELEDGWSGDRNADAVRNNRVVNVIARMLPFGARLIIARDLEKMVCSITVRAVSEIKSSYGVADTMAKVNSGITKSNTCE